MKQPVRVQPLKIGEREFEIASDDDYLTGMKGEFEPQTCKLLASLVQPGHRVLDVGANIGLTSLLFGQLAKEVESFEPSPSTFAFLEKNVQASGLDNVTVHNVGLGEADESLTLTMAPGNRAGGFVSNITRPSRGTQTEPISIRKGDGVLRGKRCDFVKIDAEGFEMHVLRGLGETIDRNRPVVALELNHWCLNAFQRTSIPDFFDFLRSVFPMLYAVEGGKYADLHDPDDSYEVMYHHILAFKYTNIVGGFSRDRLARFTSEYAR